MRSLANLNLIASRLKNDACSPISRYAIPNGRSLGGKTTGTNAQRRLAPIMASRPRMKGFFSKRMSEHTGGALELHFTAIFSQRGQPFRSRVQRLCKRRQETGSDGGGSHIHLFHACFCFISEMFRLYNANFPVNDASCATRSSGRGRRAALLRK